MKLVKAHATNYRNIIDSNIVEISQSTCLVGKNEAGKTAFLKSLECLRSTNPEFNEYGKIENYPRRYLSDYDSRHSDSAAIVMRTEWNMDDVDVAAIEAELGEGVVTSNIVTISKSYE
jgi:predicted ATP-dependent endonuclease of OLD family